LITFLCSCASCIPPLTSKQCPLLQSEAFLTKFKQKVKKGELFTDTITEYEFLVCLSVQLNFQGPWKKNVATVKLGYNEQLGTHHFWFVITGVRCNRVDLCTKISPKNLFVITECSLTTEFIITEFQCILRQNCCLATQSN
jgi:hypothetical protein